MELELVCFCDVWRDLFVVFPDGTCAIFQVDPGKIPPQSGTNLTPSAYSFHNLAHIELNAIDLAWDTVVRFSSASGELESQFFADFAHVADDESRHCLWCLQRLAELGFRYLCNVHGIGPSSYLTFLEFLMFLLIPCWP